MGVPTSAEGAKFGKEKKKKDPLYICSYITNTSWYSANEPGTMGSEGWGWREQPPPRTGKRIFPKNLCAYISYICSYVMNPHDLGERHGEWGERTGPGKRGVELEKGKTVAKSESSSPKPVFQTQAWYVSGWAGGIFSCLHVLDRMKYVCGLRSIDFSIRMYNLIISPCHVLHWLP